MWRIWVLLALPVIVGWLIWRMRRARLLRYEQEQQNVERLKRDEENHD